MSLLLDALKKAEQTKQHSLGGISEHPLPEHAAATQTTSVPPPKYSVWDEEPIPDALVIDSPSFTEPASSAASTAGKTPSLSETLVEKPMFAGWGIGISIGVAILLFSGIFVYFWQASQSSGTVSFKIPPEIATGPSPTIPSPSVTPPLPQPPADSKPAPIVEAVEKEAKVATTDKPITRIPPASSRAPAIKIRAGEKPEAGTPVNNAYRAYSAGNLDLAERLYVKVLEQTPNHREALLGLTAIAQARKQTAVATGYLEQLLELDPKDAIAQASLINQGLRENTQDLVQTESKLRTLIAQNPNASILHFTLGNFYAAQHRWPAAEQAYFNATTLDPQQADYLYNLAVSLDQLGQKGQALDYYRQALAVTNEQPVAFERALAKRRVEELTTQP